MGVLTVIDMKFPECCFECKLKCVKHNIEYMNKEEYITYCGATGTEIEKELEKPEDCPLVPLDDRYIEKVTLNGKLECLSYRVKNGQYIDYEKMEESE